MLKHLVTSVGLALTIGAVNAQSVQLNTSIVTTIRNLPVPSCNGTSWSSTFDSMRNGLQAVASSPNWHATSAACGLSMFVVNPNPNQFAVWVVNNSTLKLSDLPFSQSGVWKDIADAQLTTTIFSASTDDLDHLQVTNTATPEAFRNFFVRGATYAGMTHLRVPKGGQIFTQAAIKGTMGTLLSDTFNLPTDKLWLRAEATADAQAFQLLLPTGQTISGPFGMEPVTLDGVSFNVDTERNITFMGNATFRSLPGKVLPMVIKSPPAAPRSWMPRNLPGSSMALNAPKRFTLNDYAKLIVDLGTTAPQAASKVGFLGDVMPTQEMIDLLNTMSKPLGVFKMNNPNSNADEFRLSAGQGDPDMRQFNFEIRGKAASGGPLLRFNAEMEVFGQKLAKSDTTVTKTSFKTTSSGGFNIGLKGISNPKVDAIVDLSVVPFKNDIALNVKSPGFDFKMGMDRARISADAKAHCPVMVGLKGGIDLNDGLSGDDVVKALNVSLPNEKDVVNCLLTIADLAQKGAEEVAKASVAVANAIAGAATEAGNQISANAQKILSNPSHALKIVTNISTQIKDRDEFVCNQRYRWLTERQSIGPNGQRQNNVPNKNETDHMISTIYYPMQVYEESARVTAQALDSYAHHSGYAHEAFKSIEQYWNAHPLKPSPLPSFTNFHQASNTNAFDYGARVNQLRANADFLDKGNVHGNTTMLQSLSDWLPYTSFEQGGWAGVGRSQNELLWARCAAAAVATLPMHTADAWGIAYPKHQGKSDAMFMGRPDYLKVRQQLSDEVQARARNNESHSAWMNDFANKWVKSSSNFYVAMLNKAIEGVPNQPLNPADSAAFSAAETRFKVAAHRLKNEAVEIIKLESKVHSCQVMRTIDNMLRAKEEMKTGKKPTIPAVIPPQCASTTHSAAAPPPREDPNCITRRNIVQRANNLARQMNWAQQPVPNCTPPAPDLRVTVLDPLWYLGNHPDVRNSPNYGNTVAGARKHWLEAGWSEGRAASWNFHAPTYARVAFPGSPNQDWAWMVNHYVNHGRNEGRATMPPWLD